MSTCFSLSKTRGGNSSCVFTSESYSNIDANKREKTEGAITMDKQEKLAT